ncbi:hypothetical protein A7A08_01672 [Methyloligella halotolerans]|uniref:Uncharacterized protein n=1 Tax=Methyloligella halotolerans TaxID=1177755 RepID=A0A1E2RZH3_9HYPH|nr:hypothetical protein [Methyloligella halotolerans]ODA67637.1 hypothetical protein A7A08_01672 [Methyloligella halotolerans]
MRAYQGLLEEIKTRLEAIEAGLNDELNLPPALRREFLYLQLRFLCECIALGCLIVHGDIGTAPVDKLRKAWSPKRIMDDLERLHSDFYPVPVTIARMGPNRLHITPGEPPFAKADLLSLHAKCGDILHRGTVKKMAPLDRAASETDTQKILAWASSMSLLLNAHGISLFGGQRLLCLLRAVDKQGHAQVSLASEI